MRILTICALLSVLPSIDSFDLYSNLRVEIETTKFEEHL